MLSILQSAILGLIGLNIIVFAHELGHFLVARLLGIKVEVFSLGMGPKLYKKQFNSFEFAISLLPLGGYCKMQGESIISSTDQAATVGDMYYGKPWRRILTVAAGPAFSLLFAFFAFILMGFFPTNQLPLGNSIYIPAEYREGALPLENFDQIIQIGNQPVETFQQINTIIANAGSQQLNFLVIRNNTPLQLSIPIHLNSQNGLGYLPIWPHIPPVVEAIQAGSPAEAAGIRIGDKLLSINTLAVETFWHISPILQKLDPHEEIEITLLSANQATRTISLSLNENAQMGIQFLQPVATESLTFITAIRHASHTFSQTIQGFARGIQLLITRQVDLQGATAGPIRTTALIGNVAGNSVQRGPHDILFLLGAISLIIGLTNLLPIPMLDGGLIILFTLELLRRGKVFSATFLKIYQSLGLIIILLLMYLGISSDIYYLFQ